ncbi:MAG: insulinase family protein, partial [Bacteroidota bacterium]|nr:insulinase family protein [Bacteroidota bacterium]
MKKSSLFLTGFLFFFVFLSAQNTEKKLPLEPGLVIGKLKNGLTYYILQNKEPRNRAELRLVVNAGSVQETDKQVGLAHFVEHMCFNGTRHFQKNELVNFLEKSGVNFGADLNASTSFDETVYELQVPTDSPTVYHQAMQILEDWAHEVSFDPVEIDKERGVIVEEWRLGLGADARLRDKYFPILFKGSQYAKRLPIGTKANIDTAHYNTIRSFYKDWYRPDLEAVIVVGDVNVAETEQMIRDHFEKIPASMHPRKRIHYGIPSHKETRAAILTDPEQPYNVIQIYYTLPKAPPVTTEKLYRESLVREMFNQMISSRLDELAQKPDAPFLFGSSSYGGFIGDKDAFSLLAVAKSGKEVMASIKSLLRENARVQQFGFVQSELDRAEKNFLSRLENMYKEKDKTKSGELVQELIDHYLKGESVPGIAYEYALSEKLLPTIRLQEVNALVSQWIRPTDQAVVITAPEKEKNNLPSKTAVIAQINQPVGKLTPYIDKVAKGPLLPIPPVPGKVIAEKKFPEIGTTEWTLSNGASVVLKPTQFKNDEVQFSCISWGGTSLYPDSLYLNAANASAVASIGGMGHMDMQELQKALTGKNCFLAASLSPYLQGMNGYSTQKDLETALQLLYGKFVFPRKDSTLFQVMKEQIKVQIENKDKDPNAVFGDSVNYIMGNYHYRRKPFSIEDISRLNLNTSMRIYQERFSNAGEFLFTFVGNFSLDSIRPLIEKYIASLPAKPETETWKDVGMRYPSGRIQKVIRKGKENKASVRLFYTGNLPEYNEMDNLQLGQLCSALGIKLREVLREDAGGVYGVGVNGGISREPNNSYSISIRFGCSPENVDKLVNMVKDVIEETRKNGVSKENIEKVVAEQTRSLENEVKENSYWRYQLEQHFFRHLNPLDILKGREKISRL